MAKSQRSSRKKALRTQRAEKVTATWAAEAEAKRLEALAKCIESEPIPVVNIQPAEDDAQQQEQRGRTGAAAGAGDNMALDGEQQQKSSKRGKKGRKAAAAAAGGVSKKRKSGAGVKLAREFKKKQKKHRR